MFLQSTLLLVFAVFVTATPLEVSPKHTFDRECSKGIVFWCENLANAKRCNAVDFCISAVWGSHLSQPDSDVICDDCKEWVGKARELVKDNSEEVVKSLKWTCDLIPLSSLKDSCESLVDENVPEILKMLESAMNPEAVCSKLFFCNNLNYDEVLKTTESHRLPLTCRQCHHAGSIFEQKFKKADHDEILTVLLSFCGELSSFSDSCSSLVLTHFDDIHSALQKTVSSENSVCSVSGACGPHQFYGTIPTSTSDPTVPCELCEQLAIHLRDYFVSNATENEFKGLVTNFCHQTGSFSSECLNIVDQYITDLFYYLQNVDTKMVCTFIKMCPEGLFRPQAPSMPLVSLDIYPKSQLVEIQVDTSVELHQNGAMCTTCTYLIHYLQEELAKPSVKEVTMETLEKICHKLPKVEKDCKVLIEVAGDTIISLLSQNMKPELVCPKIKMCHSNSGHEIVTPPDERPTCQFCLMAMQEIWDTIATNKTKQNIEGALSKLCTHLSDKLVGQCIEFVKTYSSEVVEMILADFTPQEACTFIKLCTDDLDQYKYQRIGRIEKVSAADFDDESEEIANPQCELCKQIVKIVEQRVINKNSKEEIRRELEHSCERLSKFSKKCKDFVDKYSDKIVDLIEQELDPNTVCRELIFCVSADHVDDQDYDVGLDVLAKAQIEPDPAIKDSPQCVICEFVMSKLEDELNDKKTDEEIKNAVKNVCSKMPDNVSKSCNKFVDQYFNMVIAFLEMMKPSEVCAEMKLCPAKSLSQLIRDMQNDLYKCAICKGLVEGIDDVLEDPETDTNLENLEEKLCEKFVGKYKLQCHVIANKYGLTIISLMKTLTESDQVCYKLELCSGEVTGMAQLY